MNITQITVATHYTYNLGNYSNVRPEVQLSATLESHDSLADVAEELRHKTLTICQQQIDEVLELNGEPAQFSKEPRFDAYLFADEQIAFFLPHGQKCPYAVPGTKTPAGQVRYSFQIIEKFETKAAMQRRIKELEQNEHIIFENQL